VKAGYKFQNIRNWCTCTIFFYLMMAGTGTIQPTMAGFGQPQLFESFLIINFRYRAIPKKTRLKQRDPNSAVNRKNPESEENNNRLLFQDPSKYLEHHQHVVSSVVQKFAASGLYDRSEAEDVMQYIHERMLTGVLKKIQEQYRPWRCHKAYFYKIVRNLCLEYAKKNANHNRHEMKVDFTHAQFGFQENTSAEIALSEVYRQLGMLIKRYGTNQARLELFFKISLRVGITEDDVLRCYPSCDETVLNKFLSSFNYSGMHRTAKYAEIYEHLAKLINELEGLHKSADSVRKFLNSKLDEIIRGMNIPPINAAMTRDTAKQLLEAYYSEILDSPLKHA
jgi:hypothetical protein